MPHTGPNTMRVLRETIRFPGDIYVLFGISSAVFWYGGWLFLVGATLIAMAGSIAWKIVATRGVAEPSYKPNESF